MDIADYLPLYINIRHQPDITRADAQIALEILLIFILNNNVLAVVGKIRIEEK